MILVMVGLLDVARRTYTEVVDDIAGQCLYVCACVVCVCVCVYVYVCMYMCVRASVHAHVTQSIK